MKFNKLSPEAIFVSVIESLLFNYNCGKTLIVSSEPLGDKLNLQYSACRYLETGVLNKDFARSSTKVIADQMKMEIAEIEEIGASGKKYDTIIGYDALLAFRPNDRVAKAYIESCLDALDDGGRLIIPFPNSYMRHRVGEDIRRFIMNDLQLNRVVYLGGKEISVAGVYILDIIKNRAKDSTQYYYSTKFNLFEDMLAAIREQKDYVDVQRKMLEQRWDATFLDPKYDSLRKKYLSKDTIKLGSLASIIHGAIIRHDDRKETGDYLILSPRLIQEGRINYQDDRAFYLNSSKIARYEKVILKEGDIVVSNNSFSQKLEFTIYHEESIKVVAERNFYIIRAEEENQKYLQLYFGTTLGQNNFNMQLEMLGFWTTFAGISANELSSIVVPNHKTLETAARIQESKNLINKIAMLFESEGWGVIKEYKPKNGDIEYDIGLKTNGKVVGIVEAKRYSTLNKDVKNRIKVLAERALKQRFVKFFILFINDAMYRYQDNEFYRIPEIPTPTTYKLYDKDKEFYINDSHDSDVKQIPEGAAPISDSFLVLCAISNLGKKLGDKIDAVQKTVDTISIQLQELTGRITIYQDLVEKQLAYARDDLEEQERILKVFTDTCVERVTEQIRSEYSVELYEDEKKKLIDSMGISAWAKLDSDAQNFLVSSKVMYQKLIGISDIVDYSGVCLLVTKALELELGRRFCQNYIAYYKATYPGKTGRDNAPLPIINKYHKYIKAHDFTLGSFPFVIGNQFIQDIDDADKENIKNKILEYVKQGVLKTYAASHTDEEVIDLLFDFCDDVERVRKDYRNPSAHTNALTKISAKECFDLVLDVEKLLKRMLDAFDE